eukprot:scaffold19_cov169-Amphora_coffeaeformis.AAC.1
MPIYSTVTHEDDDHAAAADVDTSTISATTPRMTAEARRQKRREKQQERSTKKQTSTTPQSMKPKTLYTTTSHAKSYTNQQDIMANLLARKEDDLLKFVARVNHVYQDLLHRDAPFMTFVLCGMQSAGKSTIMERFLHSVLNIVQDGTGTRCPLDTTCIHDETCLVPKCDLSGKELEGGDAQQDLTVEQVFAKIVAHNRKLEEEKGFSTERLRLVYRSSQVQNMRFVDTPGIISTQDITSADHCESIKRILRQEMQRPHTRLCVLLQPDEYENNGIIDFCDQTFSDSEDWRGKATFLMTKFDKQLVDAKSASKTSGFFKKFFDNQCFPHLVITPTLDVDRLSTEKLFSARQELLDTASEYEKAKFKEWKDTFKASRMQHGSEEDLHQEISKRIGFQSAHDVMHAIMLHNILERLPEVLVVLRQDLNGCQTELQLLEEKKKMSSPNEVKLVANQMLFQIQSKLKSYLDGNLAVASKFPEKMQTLDDEMDEEEESDWKVRRLNHHMDKEDEWRECIANLEDSDFIHEIRPGERFLGGKQYQRAIEFFKVVMISALPDPSVFKELIPQATGFAQDGLQRENWERAMVETVKVCLQDVSQPGVNFLIKHAGSIFRRLFIVALEDVKKGEQFSRMFSNLPGGVEKQMIAQYEEMLWGLMEKAAEATHLSLEPMFSTIDPNLPTFNTQQHSGGSEEDDVTEETVQEESLASMVANFGKTLRRYSSGREAKKQMRRASIKHITTKKCFLPDQRASMITDEESDVIVNRAFEYIIALFEFILSLLKFQLNHHLYQGFKEATQGLLITRMDGIEWDQVVHDDPTIDGRIKELKTQIEALKDSLQEVKRMEHSW